VQRRQAELEKSVAALYERGAETSLDWILAEAEYLVFAANQRLALEGDVDTAAAALRSADERLEAADHPNLIPVREQLIKDIGALEAVNLPDSEGLALYLAEVVGRVADLPTKPIADLGPPFSSVKNEEHVVDNWRNLLGAVWDDLVNLVEVKDAELPDSVLFDPELRYFLQQNLRLELASARLAVLRRDTANLRASTSLLKRLLTTYYDVDDAAVGAIVKRLDAAATVELAPELPDIAGSLDKIRGYRAAQARSSGEALPVATRGAP
jgi:uroporphyrin-3 C-methyltransferase